MRTTASTNTPARARAHSRLVHRPPHKYDDTAHATPPTPTAPAPARAHSRPVHRIIVQERRCCAHSATRAAPAALGPLRTTARKQRLCFPLCITSHTAPTTRGGLAARAQCLFFFRVPTQSAVSPFCLQGIAPRPHTSTHVPAAHCATLARTHARTHARTRTHGRPAVNNGTCGPPAWLTGRLHEGGTRSLRSPLRRAPLLASPIATPFQGGRPERPGLLFLKLLGMTPRDTRAHFFPNGRASFVYFFIIKTQ